MNTKKDYLSPPRINCTPANQSSITNDLYTLNSPSPSTLSVSTVSVNDETPYRLYKYRYVVLFAYCLSKFCSGAIYGLFIPFSNVMSTVYGIRHIFVVITGFTFSAISPIATLLYVNKIILKYGVKISV